VAEANDPKLSMFELYLATAEKVSDRRAQANAWMLSVNSAIVALYGYLQTDKFACPPGRRLFGSGPFQQPASCVCAHGLCS
jgi:hypothetical protein